MNLDQQIQELVDGAPQDTKTPQAIRAIAPALKQVAEQLKHTQYYVLQTLDRSWLVTTLQGHQLDFEKQVIYAFSRLEDAKLYSGAASDTQLMALPIPVIQLLFQTVTLAGVGSLIFFDAPGNLESGTEVFCREIQALIQAQLQLLQRPQPPHIA